MRISSNLLRKNEQLRAEYKALLFSKILLDVERLIFEFL